MLAENLFSDQRRKKINHEKESAEYFSIQRPKKTFRPPFHSHDRRKDKSKTQLILKSVQVFSRHGSNYSDRDRPDQNDPQRDDPTRTTARALHAQKKPQQKKPSAVTAQAIRRRSRRHDVCAVCLLCCCLSL